MTKVTLADVSNLLGSPTSAANTINSNSDTIILAFDNTISRSGTSPNQMLADFDLNHNDLINADTVQTDKLIVGGQVFTGGEAASLNISTKSFTGNGVQTSFTLDVSPGVANNVLVEIGGILKIPLIDYNVSGTTLTFVTAPPSGVINTWVLFTTLKLNVIPDGSVTTSSFASNAVFNQSFVANQFFVDFNPDTRIHRMNDRVFIGTSVAYDGKQNPSSGDWSLSLFPISGRGAYAYMPLNATLSVGAPSGQLAGVFYARSSDGGGHGTQATIGVSSFIVNDNNVSGGADTWNYYGTTVRTSAATGVSTYGIELDVANLGTTVPIFPNAMFQSGQTGGISICTGGELGSYTGATLGTSSFALAINQNDPTGNAKWEKGIVFNSKAILGTDGVTGTGVAIAFAKGHMLQWYNSSNQKVAAIFASGVNPANEVVQRIELSDSGTLVTDAVGHVQFRVTNGTANTVNYLAVTATATGASPSISAFGSDANIDIKLTPQGTGVINFTNAQVTGSAGTQAGYMSVKINGSSFKMPYFNP